MKKLVKIFAVVLVCALALTALVACAPMPNTDYDTAKKNLEKNKYTVESVKSGEDGADQAFAGAAAMIEGTKAEDIDAVLRATNEDDELIQMVWFKTEAAAKEFHKGYKKIWDEEADAKDDAYLGISGKCVYMGTKAAINATK